MESTWPILNEQLEGPLVPVQSTARTLLPNQASSGLHSHRPHATHNRRFTGFRSSVFYPAAWRRQCIAWERKPQGVPKRPLPFPVSSPNRGTGGLGHGSRLSPRRGWKRLLLTCLRVLGLTPPGYELSLLRSLRNCQPTQAQDVRDTKENRSNQASDPGVGAPPGEKRRPVLWPEPRVSPGARGAYESWLRRESRRSAGWECRSCDRCR